MTKEIIVDPEIVRGRSTLQPLAIPVNTYAKTLDEELKTNPAVTPASCLRIYRDMALIREFETMLEQIKTLGQYEGIRYAHQGPAHLSLGQEAAAVGQCFHLSVDDHIFGSHRSHGEIIAKGLRAIEDLEETACRNIMETYFDGAILRVVENLPGRTEPLAIQGSGNGKAALDIGPEEENALDFLLYGLLAEIFGRETGFNRGMGGSMHAFFIPFGIYPNNAIVGGSADIATGSALYKRIQGAQGITIANIGDASLGCGPVWEALTFASMAQFRTLWDDAHRGGLPILFNFVNNFYGMGGQPIGETMGIDRVARVGAGVNEWGLHAECVDGNNPLSLADACLRKKALLEKGGGPALLEVICYRQAGHSPSDQSSYRTRDEIESWRAVDPLVEFRDRLMAAGAASADDLEAIVRYTVRKVSRVCQCAADLATSPRVTLGPRGTLAAMTFSNSPKPPAQALRETDGGVLIPMEDNTRLIQIGKKSRSGIGDSGTELKEAKAVSLRDALFEVLIHHFYHDASLVAYGEENRDWGGAFGVYRGLTESLPYHRLFNAPISEGAIVGTAVGYALEGGRAIAELMYCDFMGRAGDEIFNQLAKWQAMSGGYCKMPVVLRVSVGNKYGAQHSQDWTALAAHIPGLKVVFPATPYSAKGLLASALSGSDPVVFFESQRLYGQTEIFRPEGVPAEYYTLPIGVPNVVKEGRDLTLLTFGATLYRAWEAAQRFERDFNLSVEVMDGQSLVPFDMEPLCESVRKTGKLIIASDACERGGYPHTIASQISQVAFDYLDAPVCTIGAPNSIVPPAELEVGYFPQVRSFLDAYHGQIKPLPGYEPIHDRSAAESIGLSKYDVG